jgi:hypothetical protein
MYLIYKSFILPERQCLMKKIAINNRGLKIKIYIHA